jgi:hypothetical protein
MKWWNPLSWLMVLLVWWSIPPAQRRELLAAAERAELRRNLRVIDGGKSA